MKVRVISGILLILLLAISTSTLALNTKIVSAYSTEITSSSIFKSIPLEVIRDNYRITYTSPPAYAAFLGNGTLGFAIGTNGLQDDVQYPYDDQMYYATPRMLYAPAVGSSENRGWLDEGQIAHFVDGGGGLSESIDGLYSAYSQTLDIYNAKVKTSITFNNSLEEDITVFVPWQYDNIVIIRENYSGNSSTTAAIKFDNSTYCWSQTTGSTSLVDKEMKFTFWELKTPLYMVVKAIENGIFLDNGKDNFSYQTEGTYTFVLAFDNASFAGAESKIQKVINDGGYYEALMLHENCWHEIWNEVGKIGNVPDNIRNTYTFQEYYLISEATKQEGMNMNGLVEPSWGLNCWDYDAWMLEGLLTSNAMSVAENTELYRYNTLGAAYNSFKVGQENIAYYGFFTDWYGKDRDGVEVHATIWVGLGMWHYYTMTGDKNWLQNYAYPVMKGVVSWVENKTTWVAGKGWEFLDNYESVDEYYTNNVTNPSELVAGAKALCYATYEASKILGVDSSRRAKWDNLYKNLYLSKTFWGSYGQVYQASTSDNWQPSKHPVEAEMIYPAELVNEDDSLANASLRFATDANDGPYYDGHSAVRWALLEAGDNALNTLNAQLQAFMFDSWYYPTDAVGSPDFYLTTCSSYLLAVNKMFAHTQNPYNPENMIIEIFTGTPSSWLSTNVAFQNIRTDGALINSASYTPTKVSVDLSVLIDNAVKVRVQVPASWSAVTVKKDSVSTTDFTFNSSKHIVTVNNVHGTTIEIESVTASISPSSQSGMNGTTLTYTVTVNNNSVVDDNYSITVTDNAAPSWSPSVSPTSLTVSAGNSGYATLSMTIPSSAVVGMIDNITVTATSQNDNTVGASASCTAQVTIWMGTATFKLENLYTVGLDLDVYLENGFELVVKFYDYSATFENEVVIGTSPPQIVVGSENVPHPPTGSPPVTKVKKAELVLTTDDTNNIIATIASFTVHQSDIRNRYGDILRVWAGSPGLQSALRTEIGDILRQWSSAPA